jgi:Ca2+-dependent lipid-binding protein
MGNSLKLTSYVMILRVYKAENLPPLDTHNYLVDPYVKIAFAGNAAQTKKVEDTRNPEFNQELRLPFSGPTMNRVVRIEIWNDNPFIDDLVGTC